MNKVFVIIVTFNGKRWYKSCFDSLRLSDIPVQSIVIDNASSDDTVEYLKRNYPELILIELEKNMGFGQANNKGMRYAFDNMADYVFLLNQDTWIEPNTIAGLIDIHKYKSEYGVLSPMQLNTEKTKIDFNLMSYISNSLITTNELINDMYFDRIKPVYETKFVNAAAWLLPRNTIEIVGGFDPIFFHYGEDNNYLNRVHYHGLKTGFCPLLKIVHDRERKSNEGNLIDKPELNNLLVEVTDINIPMNLNKKIFFYFRKALAKLFRFNFQYVNYYLSLFAYLFKHKNQIEKSRNQNIIKISSWL